MREIKFRAWDKKTKTMREVDSIAFHNKRGMFDFDESNLPKLVNVWGWDCIEQKNIILHREKDHFELMQYTGLKDRNGKDIYEGDILQNDWRFMNVVWGEGGFMLVDQTKNVWCIQDYPANDTEVIGNIYENPELLEVTHG